MKLVFYCGLLFAYANVILKIIKNSLKILNDRLIVCNNLLKNLIVMFSNKQNILTNFVNKVVPSKHIQIIF